MADDAEEQARRKAATSGAPIPFGAVPAHLMGTGTGAQPNPAAPTTTDTGSSMRAALAEGRPMPTRPNPPLFARGGMTFTASGDVPGSVAAGGMRGDIRPLPPPPGLVAEPPAPQRSAADEFGLRARQAVAATGEATEYAGRSGLQGIKNIGSAAKSGTAQLGELGLQGAKNLGSAVGTGAERFGGDIATASSKVASGAERFGGDIASASSKAASGIERVGRDAAAASSTLASGAGKVYSGGNVVVADAAAAAASISKNAQAAASKVGSAGRGGLQAVGVLASDADREAADERAANERATMTQELLERGIAESTIGNNIRNKALLEAVAEGDPHTVDQLGAHRLARVVRQTRAVEHNLGIMRVVNGDEHHHRKQHGSHASMKEALEAINKRTGNVKSSLFHAPPRAWPTT